MLHSIPFVAPWALAAVVLIAAAIDLRTQRIPNWLVLWALTAGLLLGVLNRDVGSSLLGVLTALVSVGPLCYLGGLGMGDLKLLTAIGAWLGPWKFLMALLVTGIAGGVFAVVWACSAGFLSTALQGVGQIVVNLARRGLRPHPTLVLANPATRRMPYAPAIAVGTIFALLGGYNQ